MFSSRLPDRLAPNAMSRAIVRLRASGTPLFDLTQTNPTKVGLRYPDDLLAPLATSRGLQYEPDPVGLTEAREAVAAEYARRGVRVAPSQVVLTSSTSEAYSVLLKLLCDPGDSVLIPQPSYPLFDLLTRLEGVPSHAYCLEYHGVWSIDRGSVDRAVTPKTRAILLVNPNNPTGSMLRAADREWLTEFCADRDLALVADEVFADYPLRPRSDACSMVGEQRVLTFSLGGLSKSAGLPQIKLAWIVVGGPASLVDDAIARLEVICDTYLSVSTPVQIAAPRLIEAGRLVRADIADRIALNLNALECELEAQPDQPVKLLPPEGGWSAVVQVPAIGSEDSIVMRLLHEAHTIVHPGYFFDFPSEAFLVVSLLPEPNVFQEAVRRMLPVVAGAGDRLS